MKEQTAVKIKDFFLIPLQSSPSIITWCNDVDAYLQSMTFYVCLISLVFLGIIRYAILIESVHFPFWLISLRALLFLADLIFLHFFLAKYCLDYKHHLMIWVDTKVNPTASSLELSMWKKYLYKCSHEQLPKFTRSKRCMASFVS